MSEPSNAVLLEKIETLHTLLKIVDAKVDGKASGWVETFAKTMIGTITMGFLGALVAMIMGGGTAVAITVATTRIMDKIS